jgi:hypothetical protein
MLVPTLYKKRLSKQLSYPIGAELLSEHLTGVPQFSAFTICFSDVVSAWKSKFQRILAEGADYEIVAARLWEPYMIYVYPVRRQLKHAAQQALLSHGLPALRDSMLKHHPASPLRDVYARIMFSPPTQTVYFRERVNGKE